MLKSILLMVLFAGMSLFPGCFASQKLFVGAVDGYTKVILPEYKVYVTQDTTLDKDTKRIRIQTVDKFQELVDEAKGNK